MNHLWPQYLTLIIYALNLVLSSVLDGTPRTGKNSAGVTVAATMISAFILWRGGWWTGFGWPP